MNDLKLPKLLRAFGVVAWELPRRATRQMEAHSHNEGQLCGLDGGLAVLETATGAWTCPPGCCVWIPPGVEHSLRSFGKISGWMMRVDTRGRESLPTEPGILGLSAILKEIVVRMMSWTEESKPSAAQRRLVDVFHDELSAAPRLELYLPTPHDPALKRVSERLADSEDGIKKLAELAHETGVSERSLFRKFQEETGLTPGQWRKQAQVLRSMELLAGGKSVTETALEVGYESTGAFIRAFRQVVGVTPAVYGQSSARES